MQELSLWGFAGVASVKWWQDVLGKLTRGLVLLKLLLWSGDIACWQGVSVFDGGFDLFFFAIGRCKWLSLRCLI